MLQDLQDMQQDLGRVDQLPRACGHYLQTDSRWHHWRLDWSAMVDHPRCHSHVPRNGDVDRDVGDLTQWLNCLLYIFFVVLWRRRKWRISDN